MLVTIEGWRPDSVCGEGRANLSMVCLGGNPLFVLGRRQILESCQRCVFYFSDDW